MHAPLETLANAPRNEVLCLPAGYTARAAASYYVDAPQDLIYQPSVYALAAYLAERGDLAYVIDIGCGQANAVARHFAPEQIVGVDHGENLRAAAAKLPGARFIAHDLEQALGRVD